MTTYLTNAPICGTVIDGNPCGRMPGHDYDHMPVTTDAQRAVLGMVPVTTDDVTSLGTDPAVLAHLTTVDDDPHADLLADTEIQDPTLNDPAYLAYLTTLEATAALADSRTGQTPPMSWGEEMPADDDDQPGYFCTPCWAHGDPTGFHPYSVPPCDAAPRSSFDPR